MPSFPKEIGDTLAIQRKRYSYETSFKDLLYLAGYFPAEKNPGPRFGASGRPEQTQPAFAPGCFAARMFQDKDFYFSAALFMTENPGRDHPCVIHHQKITGCKK